MNTELTTFSFFVFCLAVWRMSSLLANEYGPFYIFKAFREAVKNSNNKFLIKLHFAEGLECEWCNSIWIAFPLSLVFDLSTFNTFIVPLAASTVVIFLKYTREAIERSNKVKIVRGTKNEKQPVHYN